MGEGEGLGERRREGRVLGGKGVRGREESRMIFRSKGSRPP